MKYKLSREESIPHYDEGGQIMQMIAFKITASVEGETKEEVQAELDSLFEQEKEKLSDTNPVIKKKDKQLAYLLSELKALVPETKLKQIIAKGKNIS